jgi:hypothetical protein
MGPWRSSRGLFGGPRQSLIYESSYGLNAWPARGELLGDAVLLRRAADAWRARGLPSGTRPRVVFAGRVHDVDRCPMEAGPDT